MEDCNRQGGRCQGERRRESTEEVVEEGREKEGEDTKGLDRACEGDEEDQGEGA